MAKHPMRVFPIPEAIAPGKWTVTEDRQARVDTRGRKMYVPVQDTIEHSMIRAHEMAHVKFTGTRKIPRHLAGRMIFQAVEDCRIHTLAKRAGVPIHDIGFPPAEIELAALQSAGNLERYVELLLCTPRKNLPIIRAALAGDEYFTDEDKTFITSTCETAEKLLGSRNRYAVKQHIGHGRIGTPWSFRRAVAVAEWIESKLPVPPGQPGQPQPGLPDNWQPSAQWGEMTIETPELTYSPIVKSKTRKVTDCGAVLTRPDRYAVDLRVFTETRRRSKRTGTKLIDTSGSMSLSPHDVAQMVRDSPADTIAVYGAPGSYQTRGVLRIIAKNGRMLPLDSPLMSVGGGNVVDGPALHWLSKQPMPRVWICDGRVTGKNECQHESLTNDVRVIKSAARIVHVNPLEVPDLPAAIKHAIK